MERLKALAALAWGLWVIAFHSFDSSETFRYLIASAAWLTGREHAEWLWGGLMIAAGGCQLWGLWTGQRRPRLAGALIAGTMWLGLGTLFMLENPASTSGVVYGQMALASFSLYFQIGTGRRP